VEDSIPPRSLPTSLTTGRWSSGRGLSPCSVPVEIGTLGVGEWFALKKAGVLVFPFLAMPSFEAPRGGKSSRFPRSSEKNITFSVEDIVALILDI